MARANGPTAPLFEYTALIERAMELEASIEEMGDIPREDEILDEEGEEVDEIRKRLRALLEEFNKGAMMYRSIDMGQLEVQKVLRLFESSGDSEDWMQSPSYSEFNQPFFTYALEKGSPYDSLAAIIDWCYEHPSSLTGILLNVLLFYCNGDGAWLIEIVHSLSTNGALVEEVNFTYDHTVVIALLGISENDPLGYLSQRITIDTVKELLRPTRFSYDTILDKIVNFRHLVPKFSQCMVLRAMKNIAVFLTTHQDHVSMENILYNDISETYTGFLREDVCSFLYNILAGTRLDHIPVVCSVVNDLLSVCDQEIKGFLLTHIKNGKVPLLLACEFADKIELLNMMYYSEDGIPVTERPNYGIKLVEILIQHMPRHLIDLLESGDSGGCSSHVALIREIMVSDELIITLRVKNHVQTLLRDRVNTFPPINDTRMISPGMKTHKTLKPTRDFTDSIESSRSSITTGDDMTRLITGNAKIDHVREVLDSADDLGRERLLFDATTRISAMHLACSTRVYYESYFRLFMQYVPRHAWHRLVTWDSSCKDTCILKGIMTNTLSLPLLFEKLAETQELSDLFKAVHTPYTDTPGRTVVTKYREGHFVMALVCDYPLTALEIFKSGAVDSKEVYRKYPVDNMSPLDLAIHMQKITRTSTQYEDLVHFLENSGTFAKGAME